MITKVIRCDRCSRRLRNPRNPGDWNTIFDRGYPTGRHLCPDCQTPEENAEAEIKAATLDYSRSSVDQFGRMYASMKSFDDDDGTPCSP